MNCLVWQEYARMQSKQLSPPAGSCVLCGRACGCPGIRKHPQRWCRVVQGDARIIMDSDGLELWRTREHPARRHSFPLPRCYCRIRIFHIFSVNDMTTDRYQTCFGMMSAVFLTTLCRWTFSVTQGGHHLMGSAHDATFSHTSFLRWCKLWRMSRCLASMAIPQDRCPADSGFQIMLAWGLLSPHKRRTAETLV